MENARPRGGELVNFTGELTKNAEWGNFFVVGVLCRVMNKTHHVGKGWNRCFSKPPEERPANFECI